MFAKSCILFIEKWRQDFLLLSFFRVPHRLFHGAVKGEVPHLNECRLRGYDARAQRTHNGSENTQGYKYSRKQLRKLRRAGDK